MEVLSEEQIEYFLAQSRLEIYLKYLALNFSKTEQFFKTSELETFKTLDNQKFKVKVA